jgi:hypothetical protein
MELQDKTITTTNITTLSNPILYVPKIMFLTKGKGLHKDVSDISDTITKYILTISMEKTVTSDRPDASDIIIHNIQTQHS